MGEPVAAVVARRRASSRATPPSSSRSSTSRCRRGRRRGSARPRTTRRSCTRRPARTSSGRGLFDWGDYRRGARGGRPRRPHRAPALRPLLVDAARVRRLRSSSTTAAPRSGRSSATTRCPGIGAIWMAPALRVGTRQAALRHAGHRRRLRQQDLPAPAVHGAAACSRASSNRPVQWTEWRTDQHMANAHGNERTFLDVEVPVKADGTMLGFKVRAIDDCGAFPRYEPLGCIIWAQVTPGLYRWRNIRVDFTQVVTNKSPVGPNRGYSRMQHLWLTERIMDIVAHRARPRPGRGAQAELHPAPRRCRTRRRTAASTTRATTRAAWTSRSTWSTTRGIEERRRRRRVARQAARDRDRLDARLRDEQLRPVAAPEPGAAVLGQQRGGDGQARHLRRDRRHARDDRRRARATRRSRRRSSPTSSASRPTTFTSGPGTTRTGTRTPASPARTRSSSRSPGWARSRARPRCSPTRSSGSRE